MSYIEIENIKIHFKRKGSGDNTIIFLHGNSCSLNYFNNQFNDERLFNDYELISFDFPGHGLSDHATNLDTYSLPKFASVLTELYKQLNIKNAVLVGNSIGGNVILEALNDLKGVKGIVLVGSSPFSLPPAENIYMPHPALPLFFTGKLTNDDMKKASEVVFNDVKYFDLVSNEIKKSDSNSREVWLANSEKIIPKDEIEIVKNIDIPIAVIFGKDEAIMNFDYIKTIPFKNLWQNKLITIPDAKHFPNVEKAEIFNSYLLDFCKEQF